MKKALSIAWKIAKGYAVLNTLTWAGIGIGRFLSDSLYKNAVFWGDFDPREEFFNEVEEAAEGYKDYFSELVKAIKRL